MRKVFNNKNILSSLPFNKEVVITPIELFYKLNFILTDVTPEVYSLEFILTDVAQTKYSLEFILTDIAQIKYELEFVLEDIPAV
jgi:hypothetical protein